MPPLYARPRHAAPRDHGRLRAALVPAVLVASTSSALGGLAVGASADDGTVVVASSATSTVSPEAVAQLQASRSTEATSRASRDRAFSEAQLALQAQQEAEARAAAEAEAARVAAEEAARPKFARPGNGRLTSGMGRRWGRLHAGIDLACGTGCPIRAAGDGVVVAAGNEGGYGRAVRIQHADGSITLYAHNSALLVSTGERVTAGQQIAREGNTGNSTGPHLHFEVRIGGAPVNPLVWLRERGVGV